MSYELLLARFASQIGYVPKLGQAWGDKQRYEGGSHVLIKPVSVSEKVGEAKGRLTSQIDFILVKCHATRNQTAILEMWSNLKSDALSIINQLETSGYLLSCGEVEVEAVTTQISKYDEVAVEVTATVVSNFTFDDQVTSII